MHRFRVSIYDGVVLVMIAFVLIVMAIPPVQAPPPLTDADLNSQSWQPGREETVKLPPEMLVTESDPSGCWQSPGRHIQIEISRIAAEPESAAIDEFRIQFRSGGRCGLSRAIELDRTGVFSAGELLLDRPVRELGGATYRKLYLLYLDGAECLSPPQRVAQLLDDSHSDRHGIARRIEPRAGVLPPPTK